MENLNSIGNRPAGVVPTYVPQTGSQASPIPPAAEAQTPAKDSVELSAEALQAEARTESLTQEQQRIQAIRAQIAAGTYLTPGKLAAVVDVLHAELTGRS